MLTRRRFLTLSGSAALLVAAPALLLPERRTFPSAWSALPPAVPVPGSAEVLLAADALRNWWDGTLRDPSDPLDTLVGGLEFLPGSFRLMAEQSELARRRVADLQVAMLARQGAIWSVEFVGEFRDLPDDTRLVERIVPGSVRSLGLSARP